MKTLFGRLAGRLLILALVLLPLAGQAAPLRILALGDSITNGGQACASCDFYASYRYPLWFDLLGAGHSVDFVGGRTTLRAVINGQNAQVDYSSLPNYPQYGSFDRQHNGYWGERTDQVAGYVSSAVSTYQPDVVLIHLGTNDIGQNYGGNGVANADSNLRLIIQRIRAQKANTKILLAQIIPFPSTAAYGYGSYAHLVGPLNTAIAGIATELNTPESPITLVNQHDPFAANMNAWLQSDLLHPNQAGEEQMAGVWFAALEPLLAAGGNLPPSVSITGPANGTGFQAPAGFSITADASDSDGSVAEVKFYRDTTLIGSDSSSPYSVSVSGLAAGNYVLTAVATDNLGLPQTSAAVNISVSDEGVPIAVTNPGFELPVLNDAALSAGPGLIQGWSFAGTANTYTGIFNPPAGSYASAGGNGTPSGAQGANAAYLFNNGGAAESVSLSQQLASTVAANTGYRLRVAVGRFLPGQPYAYSEYGGYRIELLAGSTVIASDNNTVQPNAGEFRDAVLEVSASAIAPALVGQPLSIRMTLAGSTAQRSTHFDHVRLFALPQPPSQPLPVANPSFESPAINDGSISPASGYWQGWNFAKSTPNYIGLMNPPEGSYPGAAGNGTPSGAQGSNVAYLFHNGGASDYVILYQQVGTLAASTGYSLRVAVGRFLPGQPFLFANYGGYHIDLLAGSTVLGNDIDSVVPNEGEFRDAVLTVPAASIPQNLVGQPLYVRLRLSSTTAPSSTHFDNVRLEASQQN